MINIPATTVVLKVIASILNEIKPLLLSIAQSGLIIPFRLVRKFAVEAIMLDQVELILYNAFDAPKDDLFYLTEDHPDMVMIKANTVDHRIENYEKYTSQLKSTISSIAGGGAAIFKAVEQESFFKKSLSVATHGAYYRLLKEDGVAQFRYWIS